MGLRNFLSQFSECMSSAPSKTCFEFYYWYQSIMTLRHEMCLFSESVSLSDICRNKGVYVPLTIGPAILFVLRRGETSSDFMTFCRGVELNKIYQMGSTVSTGHCYDAALIYSSANLCKHKTSTTETKLTLSRSDCCILQSNLLYS